MRCSNDDTCISWGDQYRSGVLGQNVCRQCRLIDVTIDMGDKNSGQYQIGRQIIC